MYRPQALQRNGREKAGGKRKASCGNLLPHAHMQAGSRAVAVPQDMTLHALNKHWLAGNAPSLHPPAVTASPAGAMTEPTA